MESALAVQDKLLGDAGLAERLRLVAMLRGTFAYYCANKNLFTESDNVGEEGDARRALLLKGIDATLEQAERTLEAGGAGGRWGDLENFNVGYSESAIGRLLQLRQDVEKAHSDDTGGMKDLIRETNKRNSLAVWSENFNVKASIKPEEEYTDKNPARSKEIAAREAVVCEVLQRIKNAPRAQDLAKPIEGVLSNYSWSKGSSDPGEDARIVRMVVLALPQAILEDSREREEGDLTATLAALQNLQDAHFFHVVQVSDGRRARGRNKNKRKGKQK